jgi:hypothetical protein
MSKTKLTAVTVTYKGESLTWFVQAKQVDGKSKVSVDLINAMLRKLGCFSSGQTFSIG